MIATIITANSQNNVSGTVQFFDGSKSLGTATVASNQAQITVTLTPGSHAITANYSGDSTYPPAAATNSISVHLLTTSLALTANTSSTSAGQPVTFTATVSATPPSGVASPTGQVQFFSGCLCGIFGALLDKTLIGIANVVNGVATLTTNALPGGSTQVLATYTGDANWGASTSNALNQTIAQTAAKISWISTSADANQIRLSAGLTIPPGAPAPTGSLQFVDRKTSAVLGSTSFSGTTATLTLPARPDLTGDPIVAIFSGDTNYSSSTSDPVELIALSDIASASPSSAAPDEILSIYGASLGNSPTPANDTTAPPTIVAGTQVQFTDSSGATHAAGLLFVSPNQINLVIPSDAVPGPGTLTVTNGAGTTFSRALTISTTAPTLFTTTGLSGGPAVAQIVRVNADGSQTVLSAASPIDLTSGAVYLVLYGTGIRHRTDTVSCAINGSRLPVAYAGPQSQTAGLDQVNVLLPASLKGAGQAQVSIAIGSQTSNPATLTFQ